MVGKDYDVMNAVYSLEKTIHWVDKDSSSSLFSSRELAQRSSSTSAVPVVKSPQLLSHGAKLTVTGGSLDRPVLGTLLSALFSPQVPP